MYPVIFPWFSGASSWSTCLLYIRTERIHMDGSKNTDITTTHLSLDMARSRMDLDSQKDNPSNEFKALE